MTEPLPRELEVVIEVPRFGFIKRRDDGSVDFVSPLPCPFNYGSVPGTVGGDGDREDAVVLGPRLPRGTRVRVPVVARVKFVDAGLPDTKWICKRGALSEADRAAVRGFFSFYAYAKQGLYLLRRKPLGGTRYEGLELTSVDGRG